MKIEADAGTLGRTPQPPILSSFEFWPGWLFYLPVVLQWIALGLRHGDFSLPTAANPTIETGGLCGESKTSILDQLSLAERAVVAPYVHLVSPGIETAEHALEAAGISYPLVAKPDVGCNGTGVRLVRSREALDAYLHTFPVGERVVLQRLATGAEEAGIFYIRFPGEAEGRITSLTLKSAPWVVGDGRSTIGELIVADPRMGRVPQLYLPRLGERQHRVLAQGESFYPVFVGNHCKGSVFRDGHEHITPALTRRIERLARGIPEFHFGRIDVRFDSLAALRRGEGFEIIEVNGVGSEATHVWDARCTLWRAWADELSHFGRAFAIGAANRRRGFRTSGLRTMYLAWRRQRALMASYPIND